MWQKLWARSTPYSLGNDPFVCILLSQWVQHKLDIRMGDILMKITAQPEMSGIRFAISEDS